MNMDDRLKRNLSGTTFCVDKNKLRGGYNITMVKRKQQRPVNILALAAAEHDKEVKYSTKTGVRKIETEVCADSSKKDCVLVFERHKTNKVGQQATLKGQVVIARDETDGIYYEGVVISTPTPRCAVVKRSCDGMVSTIYTRFLLPVRGAISCPQLRPGDHVLVKVLSVNDSRESYIPGIIQLSSTSAGVCLSTIILYNRQTIVTARRHLVKISKERFDFTVHHICREPAQESVRYRDCGVQTGNVVHNNGTTSEDLFAKENEINEMSHDKTSEGWQNDNSVQGQVIPKGRVKETKEKAYKGGAGKDAGYLKAQLSEQGEKLKELQNELHEQSHQHRRHQEAIKRKLKVLRNDYKHENNPRRKGEAGVSMNPQEIRKKEDDDRVTLALLEMRRSLPQIKEQEEVLARWSDEGWYYRGVIKADCEDFSYLVMDSTGEIQQTWREDILTESKDNYDKLMIKDKVIALHPDYRCIYAPAMVTAMYSDFTIQILFYNNVITELQRNELYRIPDFKYIHDVTELIKKENLWKEQAVVARNDKRGVYEIGFVLKKLEDKHRFLIQWHDGTVCEQQQQHMFGAFTRRHKISVGDKILGVRNSETYTYLPGIVMGEEFGKMIIKFCDGSQGIVKPEECYWLSDTYSDEAVW